MAGHRDAFDDPSTIDVTDLHRSPIGAIEAMNIAALLSREAGDAVSIGRTRGLGRVATKSSVTDLVTEWDRTAESLIRARLAVLRPEDGFTGEEGRSDPSSSGITWVVDPIDGTTNFAYGLPGYTVSVAACDAIGSLAGAVFVPASRELFVAARGHGAWLAGRSLRCSSQSDLAVSLIGTGFSYEASVRTVQFDLVASHAASIRDIRRMGAASFDLCSVAAGRLDAYFERGLHPWDYAAGMLIASESGAIVTDFTGGPVTGDEVLASAPGIHRSMVTLLQGGRK